MLTAQQVNELYECRRRQVEVEQGKPYAGVRIVPMLPKIQEEDTMSKATLWEVAIIEYPTVEEAKCGIQARIVLPPTAVLAHDGSGACAAAGRIAQERKLKYAESGAEVLCRPFGEGY